jgi:predicted amidohydrolase
MAFTLTEKPGVASHAKGTDLLRIGLVQCESTLGTDSFDPRDTNIERAENAIRKLAKDGVRLAVLGELYLTGYRTDEWLHRWATTVYPPDSHVKRLVACARESDIHILMGAATFGHFVPGDVYNSVLFVGPEGLIGVYRKSHVAGFPAGDILATERCFYSPGQEIPVFDSPLGSIGVHICYDVCFPEVSRVQALKGAQLLVNCSAAVGGFKDWWDHMLKTRAAENMSWYMMCSVVGEQRGFDLFGGSRVIDPDGRVVAEAKHGEEDVVVADIDLDMARRLRASSHMFSTRRPEMYGTITEANPYP